MMPTNPATLRLYLALRYLVPLFATPFLKRRLARGKEHPTRWTEKLGRTIAERPSGPLIWLHAVGLGEVLSLRGIITAMGKIDPSTNFLITSSALSSAKAIASQMPPRTQHQFMPLDNAQFSQHFLNHWQPDLVIWAEQDIWPGSICDIAKRNIPQALVNARMNAFSFAKHAKIRSLFSAALDRMVLISAQDRDTAMNLSALGVTKPISINNSFKAAAPPLRYTPATLLALQNTTQKRRVWVVAPAHHIDADLAIKAHELLLSCDPSALLIIAPRDISLDLPAELPRRSRGQLPSGPIWIADTLGELGVIYRLAKAVLIGGTFGDTEGHSPWEAAVIGCTILHGPRTANFANDYAALQSVNGSLLVNSPEDIAAALLNDKSDARNHNAQLLITRAKADLQTFAQSLMALSTSR
jgi:3-deoxy-D-manno-octulosonic-acid transferase